MEMTITITTAEMVTTAAAAAAATTSEISDLCYSEDVLRLIFDWLLLSELATCARVCKGWNNFLFEKDDDILWSWKFQSLFWKYCYHPPPSPTATTFTSSSSSEGNADDNPTTTTMKATIKEHILDGKHLATNLLHGSFVDDCHQNRSWLLCGHSKTVMDMMFLELELTLPSPSRQQRQQRQSNPFEKTGFAITIGEDGEIRSWKLPFITNRPKSKLLLKLDDGNNTTTNTTNTFVPEGVEWLPEQRQQRQGRRRPFLRRAIISGRRKLFVVGLSMQYDEDSNNNNGNDDMNSNSNNSHDNSESSSQQLQCWIVQSINLDYYATCCCLDLQHVVPGDDDNNYPRFIVGSSDSIIRVYNLLLYENNNEQQQRRRFMTTKSDEGEGGAEDEDDDEEKENQTLVIIFQDDPLLLHGHASCVTRVLLGDGGGGGCATLLFSQGSDQTLRIWNHRTTTTTAVAAAAAAAGQQRPVLLQTITFDGGIGGTHILGLSRGSQYMAMYYDSLKLCCVKICRTIDGSIIHEITANSRITATKLYEQSILCGTVDGSIVAFDLCKNGIIQQTYNFENLLGSEILSIEWLVKDQWILAMTRDGEMCLIRACCSNCTSSSSSQIMNEQDDDNVDDDRIARRITLKFKNPRGWIYSGEFKTFLAASSGYLVRALLFSSK